MGRFLSPTFSSIYFMKLSENTHPIAAFCFFTCTPSRKRNTGGNQFLANALQMQKIAANHSAFLANVSMFSSVINKHVKINMV